MSRWVSNVIFIIEEAEFKWWMRHIVSGVLPVHSLLPRYLGRIRGCRVNMPNITVKRMGPKKERRRKTTMCSVVNTLTPPREGPRKGLVKARGKGWRIAQ